MTTRIQKLNTAMIAAQAACDALAKEADAAEKRALADAPTPPDYLMKEDGVTGERRPMSPSEFRQSRQVIISSGKPHPSSEELEVHHAVTRAREFSAKDFYHQLESRRRAHAVDWLEEQCQQAIDRVSRLECMIVNATAKTREDLEIQLRIIEAIQYEPHAHDAARMARRALAMWDEREARLREPLGLPTHKEVDHATA